MDRKLCSCGRVKYGIGRLCALCQQQKRSLKVKPTRKPRKGSNPKHLEWIRTLPCIVDGCRGGGDPAHVRMPGTGGGMKLKPPDVWTVPLCREHHREQHDIGHPAFERKYCIDFRRSAMELAALSPYQGEEIA
jgi:hypothetical protein